MMLAVLKSTPLNLCLCILLLSGAFVLAQEAADPNANPQDAAQEDPFADEEPTDPFADEPVPDSEPVPDAPPDAPPDDGIGDLPEGVPLPDDSPEDGIGDLPEGVPLPDYLTDDEDPAQEPLPGADPIPDTEPLPDVDPAPPVNDPAPEGTTPEEFEGVPVPEGFEDVPEPLPPLDEPGDAVPDAPTDTPVPETPVPEAPVPEAPVPETPAPVEAAPDAAPVPEEAPPAEVAPVEVAPVEIPEPTGPSLNLEQVLELSAQQTRVTTAELELEEARLNLERRRADPLGLRVPLLEAEQRFQTAETRYLNAYYSSARELVAAYTGLQLARQEQARAAEALALSETLEQAAVIRQNNGSATTLDVQEAQNRLELAQNELTQSQDALALAEARLRSLVGSEVGPLEDLPQSAFDTELPPADVVGNSGEQNPELLAAIQASDLAEATLTTLDPLYTAPAQLESARVSALSAQEALTRAQSDFQLTIQGLYDEALSAQSACGLRQISRDNAVERLELEKARVESGLLSELQLRELELETLDAELDTFRVCRNYLATLLELQANSGLGSSLISVPQ